ncbi:MAG: hypothetical protein CMP10_20635 [Zetaproteobacteria bacterium]|nr:hypothetical protein [Pseudobdellovibrionaceae bacterium]
MTTAAGLKTALTEQIDDVYLSNRPLVITNSEWVITWINQKAKDLFAGSDKEYLHGTRLGELASHGDMLNTFGEDFVFGNGSSDQEQVISFKGRKDSPVLTTATVSPIKIDDALVGYKIELFDITALQKSVAEQEKLRVAAQEQAIALQEANSSIKDLNSQLQTAAAELENRIDTATHELTRKKDEADRLRIKAEDQSRKLEDESSQKIRHMHDLLVQSEKLSQLGTLVASIGHEISNPISALSLHLDYTKNVLDNLKLTLAECFNGDDEETINAWNQIRSEIDSILGSLINANLSHVRLKDLSLGLRTQARKEMEKTSVNLHDIIHEAITITRGKIGQFDIEYEPDEVSKITCYRSKISQVLTNIIANAGDALQEKNDKNKIKGKHFKGKISILLEKKKVSEIDGLIVVIADNGYGVSDVLKEKIFDQFYTSKPAGKGTGLGLSMCNDIAKEHGGTLSVSDDPLLEGARFELWLPLNQSP